MLQVTNASLKRKRKAVKGTLYPESKQRLMGVSELESAPVFPALATLILHMQPWIR